MNSTSCMNRLIYFTGMVTVYVLMGVSILNAQNPSDLYLRAPDIIPGTIPEMYNSNYWIDRLENPDKIVMTLDQIFEMNRNYQERIKELTEDDNDTGERIRQQLMRNPGIYAQRPDIDLKSASEISKIVKGIIEREIQFLKNRSFGNILGIQYAEHELEAIEDEMAFTNIPGTIEPQPAITVVDSRLRIIPALRPEYIGLTQTGKTRWDVWNMDVLSIASPVKILHRSKSGAHIFVFSENGYGWLKSETVAVSSQSEIDKFAKTDHFAISINDKVPFYNDSNLTYVSGWIRMGARLPLKNSSSDRMIVVPFRNINGELTEQIAWLAPDAKMSTGYLPYTRKHVVKLAFAMLDNIYDWTGGWYGRNDGTVLRDMFKTFGFDMPANGVLLSLFSDERSVSSANDSRDLRYEAINKSSLPFSTFLTSRSGHSLLYIGNYKDVPVVFDTHGYGYENEIGNEIEIRRWTVATLLLPDYLLRQDVTITNIN